VVGLLLDVPEIDVSDASAGGSVGVICRVSSCLSLGFRCQKHAPGPFWHDSLQGGTPRRAPCCRQRVAARGVNLGTTG
jgi:hypothetical protein